MRGTNVVSQIHVRGPTALLLSPFQHVHPTLRRRVARLVLCRPMRAHSLTAGRGRPARAPDAVRLRAHARGHVLGRTGPRLRVRAAIHAAGAERPVERPVNARDRQLLGLAARGRCHARGPHSLLHGFPCALPPRVLPITPSVHALQQPGRLRGALQRRVRGGHEHEDDREERCTVHTDGSAGKSTMTAVRRASCAQGGGGGWPFRCNTASCAESVSEKGQETGIIIIIIMHACVRRTCCAPRSAPTSGTGHVEKTRSIAKRHSGFRSPGLRMG